MRPARLSEMPGSDRMSVEPVSRKRPGLRSSSTECLMARSKAGARCTSSMIRRSCPPMKPTGSAMAAASRVSSGSGQSGS